MATFNIDRDRLIAVIRYPQEGDPAAVSYAFAEADSGFATEIVEFDPFTWEIEESYHVPISPELLVAAFEKGGVEPADVPSIDGVELYDGHEVEPADRSEYLPDHLGETDDGSAENP